MQPAPEEDARNADYLTSVMRAKLDQDPALSGITVEGQGDRVLLHDGSVLPVRWLGRRRVDCRRHADPARVQPIRVRAGSFGPNQPRRDLFLSPDHALLVDGVLVPVRYLVDGTDIAQVPRRSVTYWHVELPRHEVLIAEGVPAESYLDTGDRDRAECDVACADGRVHVSGHSSQDLSKPHPPCTACVLRAHGLVAKHYASELIPRVVDVVPVDDQGCHDRDHLRRPSGRAPPCV